MGKLDVMNAGVPEGIRRERFAGHFVESKNPELAYRLSYVVDKAATAVWIQRQAQILLRDPAVLLQVQELRDSAAAAEMVTARDLIKDWHDIATADPNELVSVVAQSCRFCHGIDHQYQWKDENEYAQACASAIKADKIPPGCDGGFGFTPIPDPALDCPACYGRGDLHVELRDTRRLSGPARKLYKGAKQKGDGSIEILMHDQQAARESLAKVLGAFKDGIPVTPGRETPAIPPNATPEKAQQTYMRLVVNNKS